MGRTSMTCWMHGPRRQHRHCDHRSRRGLPRRQVHALRPWRRDVDDDALAGRGHPGRSAPHRHGTEHRRGPHPARPPACSNGPAGGTSLSHARGEKWSPQPYLFFGKTYHEHYEPVRAVRSDRYKYIRFFDQGATYDVPSDVRLNRMYTHCGRLRAVAPNGPLRSSAGQLEQTNVAEDPAHAEARQEHLTALAQWMVDTRDPLLSGPVPSQWYHDAVADVRAAVGA